MVWLCLSDVTCFSPALVPAQTLGHVCLSLSIYNTENCWINSQAVPDLSCFSSSFEPCMSFSLWPSVSVCLSLMLFSAHFLYDTFQPCTEKEIKNTDRQTEMEETDAFNLSLLYFLILSLLDSPFFLSVSPSTCHYIYLCLHLNLYCTGCMTLTCPHRFSVLKQALSVVLQND